MSVTTIRAHKRMAGLRHIPNNLPAAAVANIYWTLRTGSADSNVAFPGDGQRVRRWRLRKADAAERGEYHQSASQETEPPKTANSPAGGFWCRQDSLMRGR